MLKELLKQINWVDIFVVVLLIRGAYIGKNKGLFVEAFKFLGVIAALVLAIHNYRVLAEIITSRTSVPLFISQILSFIALLAGTLVLFKLLRIVGEMCVTVEVVSGVERIGGFIVGMVRSGIVASLVIFTLGFIPLTNIQASISERSFLGPRLIKVVPAIYNFVIRFYPDK